MQTTKRQVLCLSLAVFILSAAILPADEGSLLSEKIIRLPELAVSETLKLRPEEKWLTGQILNFEIFSNASERETKDFAAKLYKFHQAFVQLFPQVTSISRDKITLVLCGSRDKYLALAPEEAGRIDMRRGNLVYSTLQDHYGTTFLINLDVQSFFGDGVSVGSDGEGNTFTQGTGSEFIDGETLVRQQYVRLLLSRTQPRPPAWLEEGVARYFDSLQVKKDKITFAQLDMSLTRYFSNERGIPRRMLSMPEFFAITYGSREYKRSAGGTFSHQALAFVHFGMLSHKGRYRNAFLQFIEEACKAPVTEDMFRRYFKMSFDDMESALRDYVQGGFYKHVVVPKITALPPPPALDLRQATDAEAGRMKGDVLRLVNRYDDARIELVSTIMRKHADPRMLGSLGLLNYETQSYTAARIFLEAAVQAKVDEPAPYVTLAKLGMAEAKRDNLVEKLSPTQLKDVLTPLYAALAQKRLHPEIYLTIADAWLISEAVPTFENLAILDEGVLAFPRNTELIFKNAALKARHGYTEDAQSLIELGLKTAKDSSARNYFMRLKSSLRAPTTP
ncbi:MAG: hypothetical protein QM715_15215 [Nibricoccus sp.]